MESVARVIFSNILRNSRNIQRWHQIPKTCASVRYSSYISSPEVRPIEEYPEVEIVHNPPEWKYVERLLLPQIVPKPAKKAEYPSGWKPVALQNLSEVKYFVARTKNHMVPVYLYTRFRGMRRVTIIRRIQGDIWQLEKEIRAIVEKSLNGKLCATRVNEMSGHIEIHGDHVDIVREYIKEKGF